MQQPIDNKLINGIIEMVILNGKKRGINSYIRKTAETCAELCKNGEYASALTEYKILLENLQKEFGL